jgi:murein L,D-transpeptidase YafK
MKKYRWLFWVFLLAFLSLGLKYGRSIYMLVIKKVNGVETVESIKAKITEPVSTSLQVRLNELGLSDLPNKILLLGLKEEKQLEVYFKANDGWEWFKTYPFTAFSGTLGPKLKEGDRQIPEGIYEVLYLNPNSSYYLSMKINYPNAFDRQQAERVGRTNLGDDIFIHGKAATIGCIPIGDQAIEELFLLAENGLENKVEVVISPWDFRVKNTSPKIAGISWEADLYSPIQTKIRGLPIPPKW